jgi:phosphohistidine swiveling domain-containing protein
MEKLYIDDDRYAEDIPGALLDAVRGHVCALARRKFQESGATWNEFVFSATDHLITAQDLAEVERRILETGYRFRWSAVISQREQPDAYRSADGVGSEVGTFCFNDPDAVIGPPDASGRAQCGTGDNVVRYPRNVTGTARYVRSSEQVIHYMRDGVPPNSIAVIDDSGGTLTAPILEQFGGIICAGGTVRSHLGILAREYGIPCLMNAKIRGLHEGELVEIESSADAMQAEAYFSGQGTHARVWKLPR